MGSQRYSKRLGQFTEHLRPLEANNVPRYTANVVRRVFGGIVSRWLIPGKITRAQAIKVAKYLVEKAIQNPQSVSGSALALRGVKQFGFLIPAGQRRNILIPDVRGVFVKAMAEVPKTRRYERRQRVYNERTVLYGEIEKYIAKKFRGRGRQFQVDLQANVVNWLRNMAVGSYAEPILPTPGRKVYFSDTRTIRRFVDSFGEFLLETPNATPEDASRFLLSFHRSEIGLTRKPPVRKKAPPR